MTKYSRHSEDKVYSVGDVFSVTVKSVLVKHFITLSLLSFSVCRWLLHRLHGNGRASFPDGPFGRLGDGCRWWLQMFLAGPRAMWCWWCGRDSLGVSLSIVVGCLLHQLQGDGRASFPDDLFGRRDDRHGRCVVLAGHRAVVSLGSFGVDHCVFASRQGHESVLEKKEKEKRLRGRCRGLDPAPGRCGVSCFVFVECVCVFLCGLGDVCWGTLGH